MFITPTSWKYSEEWWCTCFSNKHNFPDFCYVYFPLWSYQKPRKWNRTQDLPAADSSFPRARSHTQSRLRGKHELCVCLVQMITDDNIGLNMKQPFRMANDVKKMRHRCSGVNFWQFVQNPPIFAKIMFLKTGKRPGYKPSAWFWR